LFAAILRGDGSVEFYTLNDAYAKYAYSEGISFIRGPSNIEDRFRPFIDKEKVLFYRDETKDIMYFYDGSKWGSISTDVIRNVSRWNSPAAFLFLNKKGELILNIRNWYPDYRNMKFVVSKDGIKETDEDAEYKSSNNGHCLSYQSPRLRKEIADRTAAKWILQDEVLFYEKDGFDYRLADQVVIKRSASEKIDGRTFAGEYGSIPYETDPGGRLWLNCEKTGEDRFKWYVFDPENSFAALASDELGLASVEQPAGCAVPVELTISGEFDKPVQSNRMELQIEDCLGYKYLEFMYRLDGRGPAINSGNGRVVLKDLDNGRHTVEVRGFVGGIETRDFGIGFEVRYDMEAEIEKQLESLNSEDNEKRMRAADALSALGVKARPYLLKKKSETEDENLRWRIEAVLSKIE
jgi:hypothetical protein